jgi:hypothetical protein
MRGKDSSILSKDSRLSSALARCPDFRGRYRLLRRAGRRLKPMSIWHSMISHNVSPVFVIRHDGVFDEESFANCLELIFRLIRWRCHGLVPGSWHRILDHQSILPRTVRAVLVYATPMPLRWHHIDSVKADEAFMATAIRSTLARAPKAAG